MFEDSYLYYRWYNQVVRPPSNDFVIAISASGKSSMSRTGKTSLETYCAEQLDRTDEGFDAETKGTLDAGELAYDIVPDVPDHSAVCLEEAQGSPGTTGLDARRGMVQEIIDAINAILNNGNKQLTVIITAQHLPMLDKRVAPLVDAWLLIRYGPSSPEGPLAIHHGMYVEDYNFGSPQIKTPIFENFSWPRVSEDNENYQILEEKKKKAKRKDSGDGEGGGDLPIEYQAMIADRLHDRLDIRWDEVPEHDDRLTYHGDYLRRKAKEVLPDEDKSADSATAD